jgi:phosphonoacetaldehyde hydrolase
MWAVGVVRTGNEMAVSEEELHAMPVEERTAKLDQGRLHLMTAGADYVIDGVSEIEPVLDNINVRLKNGERPGGSQ